MQAEVSAQDTKWKKTISTAPVLTPEAVEFLVTLHTQFEPTRQALLNLRQERTNMNKKGRFPKFLEETKSIRTTEWKARPAPARLSKRWVEITGPAEPKMIINALNSQANVFMADIEDALSPTWEKVIQAQVALSSAYRKDLQLTQGEKHYALNPSTAELLVRPRGWHLNEPDFIIAGEPISASLFDFGLLAFRNAKYCLNNDIPFALYLPKIENHLEAQLWERVLTLTEALLSLPKSFIRCTVLIETMPAAFEMDEIIYELKDRILGLNAGRWDYIFSAIKNFYHHPNMILPDRSQVKMTVPFMAAYCQKLVSTCHRRGIHAMGGMSAFIPNRLEPQTTEQALKLVQQDKEREIQLGFDGTWVAHPDLIPMVKNLFAEKLQDRDHQIEKTLPAIEPIREDDLYSLGSTPGEITLKGVLSNIEVSLLYLSAWLQGMGAVAIHNLMEDVATAEISRSQLWQWAYHGTMTTTGEAITKDFLILEIQKFQTDSHPQTTLDTAKSILIELISANHFIPFLTQVGMTHLRK